MSGLWLGGGDSHQYAVNISAPVRTGLGVEIYRSWIRSTKRVRPQGKRLGIIFGCLPLQCSSRTIVLVDDASALAGASCNVSWCIMHTGNCVSRHGSQNSSVWPLNVPLLPATYLYQVLISHANCRSGSNDCRPPRHSPPSWPPLTQKFILKSDLWATVEAVGPSEKVTARHLKLSRLRSLLGMLKRQH